MQQEHQARALAKLILDWAPSDELLALDHKGGGEIGAIRWERVRHERPSLQKGIFGSIHFSYRLPQSLRQPTLELFMKRSTKTLHIQIMGTELEELEIDCNEVRAGAPLSAKVPR